MTDGLGIHGREPTTGIGACKFTELKQLEADRKHQVIPVAGFPVDKATAILQMRRAKLKARRAAAEDE